MTLSNPTLYASVVKLAATADGFIPATQGRLAHAAFLDLIRAVDPALAEALHASNQRKPFTVSPLQGVGPAREGQIKIKAGQEVSLRFTLLGGELFTAFTRYLLSPPPRLLASALPVLRLGELDFAISEVLTTPGSDPWAGYTGLAELCRRWQNGPLPESASQISLEFASPTVFSRGSREGLGKQMDPLPAPGMLFGSLAAVWNEHFGPRKDLPGLQDLAGLALDKQAIRAYAEETVVVGQYRLESRMFRYWSQPQIGATGHITYLLQDRHNQELGRALNLLADFAFYSGVGYKTTMGMGQVRRF
jgi:CRISPR-associated endoribonuclease Cas6